MWRSAIQSPEGKASMFWGYVSWRDAHSVWAATGVNFSKNFSRCFGRLSIYFITYAALVHTLLPFPLGFNSFLLLSWMCPMTYDVAFARGAWGTPALFARVDLLTSCDWMTRFRQELPALVCRRPGSNRAVDLTPLPLLDL